MAGVKFYHLPHSPPCMSVQLVLRWLDVDFESEIIITREKEQFKPEYLKINPIHTVPALVDDGFNLFESGAIILYLAEKYGGPSGKHPTDLKKRTEINKFLHFNGDLLSQVANWIYPVLLRGEKFQKSGGDKIREYLKIMNDTFLGSENEYIAGEISVADLALMGTLVFLHMVEFDFKDLPNVHKWAARMAELPFYQECTDALMTVIKGIDRSKFD